MATRREDPTRWRECYVDAHAIESRAALLADAAAPVPPLGASTLARIRAEVVARRAPRRGGLALRARLVLVAVLLVAGGATAGGARLLWRRYASPERRVPPAPAPTAPARTNPAHASRVAVRAPELGEPAPAATPPAPMIDLRARAATPPAVDVAVSGRAGPAAVAPSEARPRASVEPPPARVDVADAPPSPSAAKATEAALVAQALIDLRQRKDARAALATLDRYGHDFPHGVLETEALRTRVEALVQLGDLKTALVLLDEKAGGAGEDLLLTRAELRAAGGRFREALADFDQVLGDADGTAISGGDERALYGRAVCLGRLGQSDRARADLTLYQRWFPHGRFAGEVQRLLANPGPAARP